MRRIAFFIAAAAAISVPPSAVAAGVPITPNIVKARAADGAIDTCAAPCGVFFDATGTQAAGLAEDEIALDLFYEWSFDDPSCSGGDGRFAVSGKACNVSTGFIAGHLFEQPGTYTVKLCVSSDGTDTACATTDVVVSDPNEVYSGANTVCISTSADQAGCPAGATQVNNQSDFDAALEAHVGAGKRVLFHRGQSFSASSSFSFNQSHRNMLIGAYGQGSRPIVNAAGLELFRNTCDGSGKDGPSPVDTRIVGFEFRDGASLLRLEDPAQQLTLFDNVLSGTWQGSDFGQVFQWRDSIAYCESGNNPGPAEQWFIVENTFGRSSGGRNLSMTATRSAALGNTFGGAPNDHVVRWNGMTRNVISHNVWTGSPKAGLHQLKYHAGKGNDGNFGGNNRYSVVSDNQVLGASSAWPFGIGQQGQDGSPAAEFNRAEYVIVERNYFTDPSGDVQIHVRLDGNRYRFSNNICQQTVNGANGIICGNFSLRDDWPSGFDGKHRAYGNVLLDTISHGNGSITVNFGIGSDNRAKSNLVWAPSSGSSQAVSGTGTCAANGCSNNLDTSDFASTPFVSSNPTAPADFQLNAQAGAVATNAGAAIAPSYDFGYHCQPAGAAFDIGAWETDADVAPCVSGPIQVLPPDGGVPGGDGGIGSPDGGTSPGDAGVPSVDGGFPVGPAPPIGRSCSVGRGDQSSFWPGLCSLMVLLGLACLRRKAHRRHPA